MCTEVELRAEIVEIGRWMYERSYVVANDGNISVRMADGSLLITPSGACKGHLKPEEMVRLDLEGNVLSALAGCRASSELPMHLAAYRARPDVNAVVHAHPPVATGFAVAGLALDAPILPEIVTTVGAVPLVPYGTPYGVELQNAVAPYLEEHDSLLLANHGTLTLGADLTEAYRKLESLELCARIRLVARLLGHENTLSPEDIGKLLVVRSRMGSSGRNPLTQGRAP